MFQLPKYVSQLQKDVRLLRIHNANLQRYHLLQKQKSDQAQDQLKEKDKRIKELERENSKLDEELEKVKQERDTYKNLAFKEKRVCTSPFAHTNSGRKRGGQRGHPGISREKPTFIHEHIRVFLSNCPDCGNSLSRTEVIATHTITDIPHWSQMKPTTTEYQIERQWCRNCHKEVRGVPSGVIPGSRFGIVLVVMVIVWKYRFRDPLNKIAERLLTHYGLRISEGELAALLHRARDWLGPKYDEIIKEIRGSPVKHADETGWPVGAEDFWAWTIVSPQAVAYTIEESRGGGVAKQLLEGAGGVLVRDDYRAYLALKLIQQSCWAHLLRVSHNLTKRKEASGEMKHLHHELMTLFLLLSDDVSQPFNKQEREEWHKEYTLDLEKIINRQYHALDAKAVQTRIRNQRETLLTALLHEGVSLTNNAAERAILPLVITRKISRGSKTPNGAKTHAVNMSVIETIVKKDEPLLDTLHSYLLQAATD